MVSPKSCKFFTNQFSRNNFLFNTSTPEKLGKAECGGCQWLYIAYRAIWCLFWLVVFVYDIIDEPHRGKYWTFLTNWSYLAAGISSLLQLISAIYVARREKEVKVNGVTPSLLKVNWFVYSLATTATVMVSILYWGLLYENDHGLGFTNIATHAVNSAYALSDLLITGVPFRILHFWIPTLFAIVYIAFTLIYWAISGSAVYDILDYGDSLGLALAYAIGSLIAGMLLHFVLYFVYWLRVVIYDSCACCQCGDRDEGEERDYEMGYRV